MPRAMSPPKGSSNSQPLQEMQPEPDISLAASVTERKTPAVGDSSTRPVKRSRRDGVYQETDQFAELKNMLESWKADQDIILNKLVTEVSELRQQNISIQNTNLEIEKSIKYINTGYEDMRGRLDVLERRQSDYERRLLGGGSEAVSKLEAKIDSMEQQARQCNIEICNLPEKRNENLITLIDSIGKALHFPVAPTDIITIHRVPHAEQRNVKPKNIIVKLKSKIMRDNLISAYRKVKCIKSDQIGISGAAVPIYMNEHLTLKNKTLFRNCRDIAREKGYKYVWIKNATILVRERDGSPAFAVRSDDDLSRFMAKDRKTTSTQKE